MLLLVRQAEVRRHRFGGGPPRDRGTRSERQDRDKRLTVWEATHHMIMRPEIKGEQVAAELLAHLRKQAAPARDLAYRLDPTCVRKGWAEEARSYNGLVVAWPEMDTLAASAKTTEPIQGELL